MFYIETIMKIATYSVVLAEIISILTVEQLSQEVGIVGAIIGFVGDAIFAILMLHLQILQEEQYLPSIFGEE